MFLDFYQLKEQPFGVTPDPNFLYLSASHREALASLSYGVKTGRGLMALIAPPGMGKTTLLFRLLEHLRGTARTAFLFQTQCDSNGLLRYLLADLGINATGHDFVTMHEQLNEQLLKEARAGRRFVLVIDEAQNLTHSVLETARLLTDFETPREKLLQIVFAGQPQLAQKLSQPELAQLRQRIAILGRLQPLGRSEVTEYIDHRLRVAGYTGRHLFTPAAIDRIATSSKGTPRNINNLCFNALSLGCALRRRQIDADVVGEVMSDLDLGALTEQRCQELQSSTLPVPNIFPAPAMEAYGIPEATIAGFEPTVDLSTGNDDPEYDSVSLDELRGAFLAADGTGILVLESLEHAQERKAEILVEINDDAEDLALQFASKNPEETVEEASDFQSSLGGASVAVTTLGSSFDRCGEELAADSRKSMTEHMLGGADMGASAVLHHVDKPVRTGRWSVFAFAFVLALFAAQPLRKEIQIAVPEERESVIAVPSGLLSYKHAGKPAPAALGAAPEEISQKFHTTSPRSLHLRPASTIAVIVQPRDDLRQICLRYLGLYTDRLVSQINELNPGLTDGNRLAVGQRIVLPGSIAVADNVSVLALVPKP